MPALVSALNRVDLPTLGRPTMPQLKPIGTPLIQCQKVAGQGDGQWLWVRPSASGGRTIAVDRLHQCPVIGVHELRGKVTNLNDHVLDQAALIRRRVGQNIPDYRVPVPRVPHADAEAPEVRAAERGLDVL